MARDPFADDVPEDVPADDTPLNTDTEETDNTVADYTTPETPGTEVSVTLKGGSGYDAPWVVLRGPNVAAVSAMLDEDTQDLLRQAAKYGNAFGTLVSGQKPAASAPAASNRAPAAATQAPNGEQEFWKHGEMTYRSGVSKSGKAYKMFACPERDRDAQCDPVWVK